MAGFTLGCFNPFLHNRNGALLRFLHRGINLKSRRCKCLTPEEVVAVLGTLHHKDWCIGGRYEGPSWSQFARDCSWSPGVELAEDEPVISDIRSLIIQFCVDPFLPVRPDNSARLGPIPAS